MFLFCLISVFFCSGLLPLLKRLKLSAAGENNVHLLQHYQRSNAALLAKPPLCVTQPSCLLYGFLPVNEIFTYLFLLTCFNFLWFFFFFQDNCWFTIGWLKDLLLSVMHSFVCWPSKPHAEGLNMESTSPGFLRLTAGSQNPSTNPSIGPLRWHSGCPFPHTLLHICRRQVSHVLTPPSVPTSSRWLERPSSVLWHSTEEFNRRKVPDQSEPKLTSTEKLEPLHPGSFRVYSMPFF